MGTRQDLLQGWLLCVGFVCLANVPDLVRWLFLSSTSKTACAIAIKEQLPPMPEVKNTKQKKEMYNPLQCPCCKKETMHTILRFNRRGPPADWEDISRKLLECLV